MRIIKTLTIFVLMALNLTAFGQGQRTISGFVRDANSGEPQVGVTIIYGNMQGVATNNYGFYSFTTADKEITVSFKCIGYKDKQIQVKEKGNVTLDITLEASVHNIEGVEVRAREAKFANTRALGITSINADQLKYIPAFMGESDIFKYFQLLPGVSSGTEASSGLNLRGGSSDQTLILMDDIPIYNSSHAFGFISIFSGEYIRSAELYKGYIPAEYGGRLSGVATMNIREGNRKEHNQSLQLGTLTFSGLLEGPIAKGKGSYLVAARYFVPDLFLQAYNAFTRKAVGTMNTLIGFYDVTAKASYDIGKRSTLYASFYTGNDAISFLTSDYFSWGDKQETIYNTTRSAWGNIVGALRFSSQVADNSFLNITSYYSYIYTKSISKSTTTADMSGLSDIRSKMGEFGLKANMNQNFSSWYDLNYGIHLTAQGFKPQDVYQESIYKGDKESEHTVYNSRSLYTANIYADNRFKFGDFVINAGGRVALYNNNSENRVVVEPRLAATYYMPNGSGWVSYTRNSQPVYSMVQQASNNPFEYWVPFQAKYELPTSDQLTAGYRHNFKFGLEVQVEGYYKWMHDITMVHNINDFLVGDGGYEIAEGRAYGFEFLAQYNYKRLSVMTAYAYSRSQRTIGNTTFDFKYDTPHDFNLLASYKTVLQKGREHTLSLNVAYKTGIPYYLSNVVFPSEDGFFFDPDVLVDYPIYTDQRLTDYFRVDLSYTFERKLKNGSRIWQISLLNATAHRNPYSVVFKQKDYTLRAYQIIPFLPSFSYTRRF